MYYGLQFDIMPNMMLDELGQLVKDPKHIFSQKKTKRVTLFVTSSYGEEDHR